ncbi:uncharacterized protein LOC126687666 [Mercurialis annua]|uniref:uncharacterized protein LOC126687666 n=1 Tax=Mercurialis annua TaxID=3986 RepID=UPI0024AD6BC0|nr:uncharacterized protein LOC126687666 [Mercurialis annua]
MATNTTPTSSVRSILEKDKLNGTNFLDWCRKLRIVLRQERKEYILDQPLPEEPAPAATRAQRDAYTKHLNDSTDVTCIMLGCMENELQKQMMELDANTMITDLMEMFQERARIERFNTIKDLLSCNDQIGDQIFLMGFQSNPAAPTCFHLQDQDQ